MLASRNVFIAGTRGPDGEELHAFTSLNEAVRHLETTAEEGFPTDDLVLFVASPLKLTFERRVSVMLDKADYEEKAGLFPGHIARTA